MAAAGPKPAEAAVEHAAGAPTRQRDVLEIWLVTMAHGGTPHGRTICRVNRWCVGTIDFNPADLPPGWVSSDDVFRIHLRDGLTGLEKRVVQLCGMIGYTPHVKFIVEEGVPCECIGLVVDRCIRLGLTSFTFEGRPDDGRDPVGWDEYIDGAPEPPDDERR